MKRRFRNGATNAFLSLSYVFVGVIFLVESIGTGIGADIVGSIATACSLVLAFRAARLSMVLDPSGVHVYGQLRTLHLPWSNVAEVVTAQDSPMNPRSIRPAIKTTDGRVISTPGYSAVRRRTKSEQLDSLNAAVADFQSRVAPH